MKRISKIFSIIIVLLLVVFSLIACEKEQGGGNPTKDPEHIDYAAAVKLDMNSDSVKQKVTIKLFVDGDTTHFFVPDSVVSGGVLKARYIAINTPESTGKIEEYGKKASNFTKEKLSQATSIYIESDDSNWNADSTGGRYLVWVWYRTSETEDYRNLNIEILQNGLAIASSSANNRYGATAVAALNQAKAEKLNIYSGKKDPDFFYGEAIEMTLKELRTHVADYTQQKVAFNGIITKSYNNSVWVEDYDEETDLYYGMQVYYGYGLVGDGLDVLTVGNEVRIVGTVSYYEAGGTYQVSGLQYRAMKPDDPNNIQKLSEGHEGAYRLVSYDQYSGKVSIEVDEQMKEFKFGELCIHASLSMNNLTVTRTYTTMNEDSSSYGAITLTCRTEGGDTVTLRTIVLHDAEGKVVTADMFEGKVINVKGLLDVFDGEYQIKVYSLGDITFVSE